MLISLSILILDMVLDLMHAEFFSSSDGNGVGTNVIIFGVDNSSSAHIDDRRKNILFCAKGLTEELNDNSLTAEAEYPINFTDEGNKFCLILHYNGSNIFSFVNGVKIQSKRFWNKKSRSIVFGKYF